MIYQHQDLCKQAKSIAQNIEKQVQKYRVIERAPVIDQEPAVDLTQVIEQDQVMVQGLILEVVDFK